MHKRKLKKVCPRCRYSLADLPDEGVCPECGRAYDPELLRRYVLYRREVRWLWRLGIGWPVLMLIGLAITGALRPVGGPSLMDRYIHIVILVGALVGILLPIFVVLIRHARALLRYGDQQRVIVVCTVLGGVAGMTVVYGLYTLFVEHREAINPYLLFALIPVLNCLLAYAGSVAGERIGVRLQHKLS